VYNCWSSDEVYDAGELRRRQRDDAGLDVAFAYTRAAPEGWTGRI
jgi:hypothetical protein